MSKLIDLTDKKFGRLTILKREKPNNIKKYAYSNQEYFYNGIDRVDNSKGYTMDNVVSCCRICNVAKQKMTLQEYKDWVEKVYKKFKGGE